MSGKTMGSKKRKPRPEPWNMPAIKRRWYQEKLGTNSYRAACEKAGLQVYDANVAHPPFAMGAVIALFPDENVRDFVMALVNSPAGRRAARRVTITPVTRSRRK